LARLLVRLDHVARCIVNAKLSDRPLPENAFAAIVNFVEISLCASVAPSPIATIFSSSELAAAGYCILAPGTAKNRLIGRRLEWDWILFG